VQHTTRFRQGIVLLTTFVLLAVPRNALATIFVTMSDADLTATSDVVLTGTVTGIRSVVEPDGRSVRTYVTLDVGDVLKGVLRGRTITISEPGGVVGTIGRWVHGAPEFTRGEDVFLFLQRGRDGSLSTTSLGLGKYQITGQEISTARRTLHGTVIGGAEREVRSLKAMTATIRAHVMHGTSGHAEIDEMPHAAFDTSLPHSDLDAFTFLGPARWNEVDADQTIQYFVDEGGEPGIGLDETVNAVARAMGAWTDVPTARITLAIEGTAPARPMACDGLSQIVFNDPFGDVPDPSNCSGILALGGFCANSATKTTVNGVAFSAITEANITFNNGFSACSFWGTTNIAEVLTHEIGHSIGLGHSSESAGESTPGLVDATMYYRAHFDGRGAAVRPDDIAAVSTIYPDIDPDDLDGDGATNEHDNCANDANAGQIDTDGDGMGDLCDSCPAIPNTDPAPPPQCGTLGVESFQVKRSKSGFTDRLTLRGTFDLAEGDRIDEGSGGVALVLVDRDGSLLSQNVSARAARAGKRRVRLRYRTADRSLHVKIKSRDGQRHTVKVTGKRLSLRDADAAPIVASLTMGSHAFSSALTRCTLKKRGRQLICVP
jgi:hypothetical protein